MALSKDDIINALESMTVVELFDLVKAIEEKFGVKAAAAVAAAPAAGAAAAEGPSTSTSPSLLSLVLRSPSSRLSKESLENL